MIWTIDVMFPTIMDFFTQIFFAIIIVVVGGSNGSLY